METLSNNEINGMENEGVVNHTYSNAEGAGDQCPVCGSSGMKTMGNKKRCERCGAEIEATKFPDDEAEQRSPVTKRGESGHEQFFEEAEFAPTKPEDVNIGYMHGVEDALGLLKEQPIPFNPEGGTAYELKSEPLRINPSDIVISAEALKSVKTPGFEEISLTGGNEEQTMELFNKLPAVSKGILLEHLEKRGKIL